MRTATVRDRGNSHSAIILGLALLAFDGRAPAT